MKKKIEINYTYTRNEFLVRFFEDDVMVRWEVYNDSKQVYDSISKFYFG